MTRTALLLLVALAILATAGIAHAAGVPGIARHVIAGGSDALSAGAFTLHATIGQPVAGRAGAGNREVCAGYWCVESPYTVFLPLVIRL